MIFTFYSILNVLDTNTLFNNNKRYTFAYKVFKNAERDFRAGKVYEQNKAYYNKLNNIIFTHNTSPEEKSIQQMEILVMDYIKINNDLINGNYVDYDQIDVLKAELCNTLCMKHLNDIFFYSDTRTSFL